MGPPLTIGSAGGTRTASTHATSRSARGVTRRIGPPIGGYFTVAPDRGPHGTHAPCAWRRDSARPGRLRGTLRRPRRSLGGGGDVWPTAGVGDRRASRGRRTLPPTP